MGHNGHGDDPEYDDPSFFPDEEPAQVPERPARQAPIYRGYGNYGDVPLGVGMRVGPPALFVREGQMPRLRPEHVAQACDNLVCGQDCYSSLVYLGRARAEDTRALFDASQSPEIRIRWERLWVLSPYFAKLARTAEGRSEIGSCMRDDLPSIHLLSKFAEQHNSAVERLFKRMHDDLLSLLLARLVDFRDDPRRTGLLSGIIAAVETDADIIEKNLEEHVDAEAREQILPLLIVRRRDPRLGKLSSGILRGKLEQWGRE